ncbi:MFS transporter, FSR family, fosmidomycin resistance protein [Blastococcus aurantiacus]|uniref:MFS transporter, FSR family, fosmidomycin resistance protein n=1 Tax=Blastococcus aurantiacus TaxID=1550231 RepID=A0A1G7R580_9ACTN|nr:MFS transporter [Blastococcus aurantiacus]SDG05120.1 MFS transporter, FSR family, fosmidomycin resistance protein [Blastococcus aurantiacus]
MSHIVRKPGVLAGTRVAVFLALVHAVNDVLTAILGALLPTLQARFAASTTTLAVLVAAFSISSSVTQPFLGAVADRVGLRQVAGIGVALAAVSLSLVGVAGSMALLLALLILGGIGSAALHPVATSIVGGPSAKNPGLAVGQFTAGGMVGFAAGPVLVLFLISRWGTDATPWLMIPGLLLAVGVLTLLPVWEPHSTGHLRRVFDRRLLASGPILKLTSAAVLISLTFITVTSAVPLWLVADQGLATDAPLLGWTLGVFSLMAGLGAVVGGAIAARVGYGRTTALSLTAAVPALIAVLLVPPGAWTLVTAAVAGLFIYASQPLLIVAAQNHAPQAPAAAAGIVIGVGHAVAGLLYVGVGALQGAFGLAPTMAVTFTLLIPAAVIATRALRGRDGSDMGPSPASMLPTEGNAGRGDGLSTTPPPAQQDLALRSVRR